MREPIDIKECISRFGGYSNTDSFIIREISSIEAPKEGSIVPYLDERYRPLLKKLKDREILILSNELLFKPEEGFLYYLHQDPCWVLIEIIKRLYCISRRRGIHHTAFIERGASIPKDCYIGPFVYIGENVKIGSGTIIEAGSKIKDSIIGENVYIGENSVIGAEGFSFLDTRKGKEHIPHVGRVIIKDNVFIGANCVVVKGTFVDTVIEEGVKIDSLVHIAHNVTIGRGTVIAAQTGIAGSSKIGKGVMIGGQVGIADHRRVGDYAIILAKSGPLGDVKEREIVGGYPALPRNKWLRIFAWLKKQI